jgi:hypothetical protein
MLEEKVSEKEVSVIVSVKRILCNGELAYIFALVKIG